MSASLSVALPDEIAVELINSGAASIPPNVRDGSWAADVAVVGLGISTTLITLAQAPGTIEDLARRLAQWRRGRDGTANLVIDAQGPRGSLRLDLEADTPPEDIAQALRLLAPRDNTNTDA